jgi:hypothetical protein
MLANVIKRKTVNQITTKTTDVKRIIPQACQKDKPSMPNSSANVRLMLLIYNTSL